MQVPSQNSEVGNKEIVITFAFLSVSEAIS